MESYVTRFTDLHQLLYSKVKTGREKVFHQGYFVASTIFLKVSES